MQYELLVVMSVYSIHTHVQLKMFLEIARIALQFRKVVRSMHESILSYNYISILYVLCIYVFY